MAADPLQKHKLKKIIKELEAYKGRHTELVSVYVPAGYDMNKIMTHLNEEQGTASNIKSAATRKNVETALEKMIQHLRIVGRTPPNGIAVFSGNIAEQEGKQDFRVWSVEPPAELNQRIYRCDKQFVLEPLQKFLEPKEVYGLVVMDRREGTLALLKGKVIEILSGASSNVPGKTKAGGQSAMRFARLREGAALDFFKKLAEMMKKEYLNRDNLKGIIVGGPGHTKYEFLDTAQITDQVKRKIIAVKDVAYTDEFGIQELLEKSEDILAAEEVASEKKLVQKFLFMLAKERAKVSYGAKQVNETLEMGAVETLLISEALSDAETEAFEEKARQFGTTVVIISLDTREGVQLKELGKVAAILRFPIET